MRKKMAKNFQEQQHFPETPNDFVNLYLSRSRIDELSNRRFEVAERAGETKKFEFVVAVWLVLFVFEWRVPVMFVELLFDLVFDDDEEDEEDDEQAASISFMNCPPFVWLCCCWIWWWYWRHDCCCCWRFFVDLWRVEQLWWCNGCCRVLGEFVLVSALVS